MTDLKSATGGDGWSGWTVRRTPTGGYEIVVLSHAEQVGGYPKVLHDSEVFHERS